MNGISRRSRQREVILEELCKVTSHPTADELYEMVRKRLPRISLGTVYRNLEKLSQEGRILRIDAGDGRRRYDGRAANHYHIRCIKCGRVDDVTFDSDPTLDQIAVEHTDYQILGHSLLFYGICPKCKQEA